MPENYTENNELKALDRRLLDLVAERARLVAAEAAFASPAGAFRFRPEAVLDEHRSMHAAADHGESLGLEPGDTAVVLVAINALCRNAARLGTNRRAFTAHREAA